MRLTNSSLESIDMRLRARWLSRQMAVAIILAALIGIFILDRATGTAPVQHLYYLPIIYAAAVLDTIGGLAAALGAIGLYHLANHAHFVRSHRRLDVVQIMLFII